MATQHIPINSSASRLASQTQSLVDTARSLQEQATKVVRIMEQVKTGDDWTSLAAYLGVAGGDVVKAQAVYNLLIAFQAVINKANYDLFIDRLG
jgi:hypothetical protein